MVVEAVPEGKYVTVTDGLMMHYHEAGTGERGTVLFIHGSGPGASGWSNYKRNYPVLAEAGYRTLVPDTLGYGYSSKPEDGDYGLDYLAGAYLALLDGLGVTKVTIVGNSQGGAIAILMARKHPDRVERLVLMAPGGLEKREVYMELEGIQTMTKVFFAKDGITRESMRQVFGLQLFNRDLITDEIIEERYQIAVTQPKSVIGKMRVDNQEDVLHEIQCPTLCFWGANDVFCPISGATKIATRVKRSKTILLSECGHWVMVEYRDFFNATVLGFLAGEF